MYGNPSYKLKHKLQPAPMFWSVLFQHRKEYIGIKWYSSSIGVVQKDGALAFETSHDIAIV